MSKHTPGPWLAGDFLVMAPDGDAVAEVFQWTLDGTARSQRRADICLIAAAPDLLAALKALLDDDSEIHDAVNAARAAIAKAEGES